MKADLSLSIAELGLFYSFTYLAYICTQMPAGWFVDRFGIRTLLVVSQVVVGGASLLMYTVTSALQGWLVEFLAGLGAGSLLVCTTKAIAMWFPTKEKATAMGIQQASLNLGGVGTAILMPAIALASGWRFGFVLMGAVAIVSAGMSLALFRELPPIQTTNQRPEMRPKGLRKVLTNRNVALAAIGAMLLVIVEFCLIMNLVLFMSESILLPVVVASGYLALVEGAGALGKPLFGAISDRLLSAKRRPIWVFAGITSLACSVSMVFLSPQTPALLIAAMLALFGLTAIGWGGLFLTMMGELAGKELSGVASGFGLTMTSLGIVIGPPIFGLIVDTTGSYQLAWAFTAICAAAGTLLISLIREEKKTM
jgi:sugar phosphate permease